MCSRCMSKPIEYVSKYFIWKTMSLSTNGRKNIEHRTNKILFLVLFFIALHFYRCILNEKFTIIPKKYLEKIVPKCDIFKLR